MKIAAGLGVVVAAALPGFLSACSGGDKNVLSGPSGGGSSSQAGGGGSASGNVTGGGDASGGMAGTSTQGGVATGGGGAAASGNGGNGGTAAGTAGQNMGGTSAGSGGYVSWEPGDTMPARALMVTASAMEHQHGNAGMDARAKSLGKLVVDIGVNSGGYVSWLAKRGYHSIGAPCGACPAPNLDANRDDVGTCRLGEFANTEASVKKTLTDLQSQYPEEDWGYFLNADGNVRWSDVAITGMSHGATTAAVAGRVGKRMWRVVSRSGPRDDTCGNAGGMCTVPLSTPSYDQACPQKKVASWLDQTPLTPINRFYGLVGTTDVECGDIMFDMFYAKYPGAPTLWNMPNAVLTGTNQFFSTEGGHLDFLNAANKPMNTDAVLNIAFDIPPENQNPAF